MKHTVVSLLSRQAQCVLATQGDQGVGLHLMAYAFSDDVSNIYIASLANTQKVSNMRSRPNVTCLWDNRTGNNSDHVEGLAMSGFGQALELTNKAEQSAFGRLLERNASLKNLLSQPSVVIFVIQIDRYQWVEGYTRSMIYKPEKNCGS